MEKAERAIYQSVFEAIDAKLTISQHIKMTSGESIVKCINGIDWLFNEQNSADDNVSKLKRKQAFLRGLNDILKLSLNSRKHIIPLTLTHFPN